MNVFATSSLSNEELNDLGSMNREAEMLYSRKLLQVACLFTGKLEV